MTKFNELNLNPKVLKAIEEAGYETPTPIQEGAIPPALEGLHDEVLGGVLRLASGPYSCMASAKVRFASSKASSCLTIQPDIPSPRRRLMP